MSVMYGGKRYGRLKLRQMIGEQYELNFTTARSGEKYELNGLLCFEEKMTHCWKDKTDFVIEKFGMDSPEYVDAIVNSGTCMLEDGHDGPCEFTADDQIIISFAPRRIQRKRCKGWRMPSNTVYVGRPTKWGNPYNTGDPAVDMRCFRKELEWYLSGVGCSPDRTKFVRQGLEELRGKNLACWCAPDQPCHADVLLELANLRPPEVNL